MSNETLSKESDNYSHPVLETYIAHCQPRCEVCLCSQNLTDQDIRIVITQAIDNKQCTKLNLGDNNITSKGVSILANGLYNNTTLEMLSLYENRVCDTGVHSLIQAISANNKIFKSLCLSRTGITDQGVQYLAEFLKANQSLTQLWLDDNKIGDSGVQLLADALAHHNTSLMFLNLSENKLVSDASVDSLVDMLKQNRSLNRLIITHCNLSATAEAKLREVTAVKKNFRLQA